MQMRRDILAAALVVVACCCVGLAASLTLATTSLATTSVATPRCTNAALLVTPNLSGANVVSVTVSSLPAACGNATIQAAVNNGVASSSGSATVPAGGGSVTVTLTTAVAETVGQEIDVVVAGP